MRILIAHGSYRTPGGEDSYVRTQVDLLSEDHDVCLILEDNDDLDGNLKAGARAAFSLGLRKSTIKTIENFEPDVIHVHNIYPSIGPVVHQTAKTLDIPLVMTVHNYRLRCPNGVMFTEGKPCDRCVTGRYYNAITHPCFPTQHQSVAYASTLWTHRFLNHLEGTVEVFIAPSSFMSRKLREWGIENSRIRTLRHATKNLETPSDEIGRNGGYMGRLSEEKGVDILLRALRQAGDPPFEIAGDGPKKAELVALASQLKLENVEFLGYVPPHEIERFLQRTRFLVFPSVCDENNPLAACEAMSVGRPIVVSDRGGLPELAGDGRGIICRSGDVSSFADSIRRLTDDDSLCAQLGHGALEFAKTEFTTDTHREKLVSIYEEILERRPHN